MLLKIITTTCIFGLGTPIALIGPTLFIGTLVGLLIGILTKMIITHPSTKCYCLVRIIIIAGLRDIKTLTDKTPLELVGNALDKKTKWIVILNDAKPIAIMPGVGLARNPTRKFYPEGL